MAAVGYFWSGHSAGCKSNLRQLGLALNLYTQQEHAYPFDLYAGNGLSVSEMNGGFSAYLHLPFPDHNYELRNATGWTYLGPRASVWTCPSYNRLRGLLGVELSVDNGSPVGYGGFGVSYGYNEEGSVYDHERLGLSGYYSDNYPMNATTYIRAIKESEVAMPSDMIAIGDAFLLPDNMRSDGYPTALPPVYGVGGLDAFAGWIEYYNAVMGLPANDTAVQATAQRHGGRWNINFCDGHVENLKPSNLFTFRNSTLMQCWNRDHQPHNTMAIPQ